MPQLVYPWLVHSAIASLIVLIVGSGVVLLCRQPTRRVRIIELSLIGCLVAPWLGLLPGYPRLEVGRWAAAVFDRHEVAAPPMAEGISQPAVEPISDPPVERSVEPVVKESPRHRNPQPPVKRAAAPVVAKVVPVASPPIDIAWWIVALYVLGVAIAGGWWLAGIVGLVWILWTARPAPAHCRELLNQIAGRRGERVRLIVNRRVNQPFASAWGRPVIVLPENLCGDAQSLRWCLAHEWTHVERHDFRMWLLAGLARVLFFYQPLMWWLRRQLRLCQDYVADARAVGQARQPADYAEFLTLRAAAGSLQPAIIGLGMGFRKSELYRRVVMLVENEPIEGRVPRLWSAAVTLAALVLVAALAATLSVPQAIAQGQPDKALKPGEEKPAESPEATEPFTAKLPGGITVELLGVCENPSKGHAWWRPDGSPLAQRPYEAVKADIHCDKNQVAREFAVQLRNLPSEPVGTQWGFYPWYNGAADGVLLRADKTQLREIAVSLDLNPQKTTVVRFGVAAGPWKTVKESARGEEAIGSATTGIAFSQVYEKDDAVIVAVAHNMSDCQARVVAVDKDGKEHTASSSSGNGARGFYLLSAMFSKLFLDDVKVFRLQTRAYDWVEFDNVSLQPGLKKEVATHSFPAVPPTPPPAVIRPMEQAAVTAIKKALASPTELDFDKFPLEKVIEYLSNFHHIQVLLDTKALADVEIEPNLPITIRLKGVSLRSALRLLLRQHGLTYVIQDEVLLITSAEEADNRLETIVYPVGDLLLPTNAAAGAEPDLDPLIEMIKTVVKPTSWDDTGGAGSVVPFDNLSLVVAQTQEVHEGIEDLLENLRTVSRERAKQGLPLFKPRPAEPKAKAAPKGDVKIEKSDIPKEEEPASHGRGGLDGIGRRMGGMGGMGGGMGGMSGMGGMGGMRFEQERR